MLYSILFFKNTRLSTANLLAFVIGIDRLRQQVQQRPIQNCLRGLERTFVRPKDRYLRQVARVGSLYKSQRPRVDVFDDSTSYSQSFLPRVGSLILRDLQDPRAQVIGELTGRRALERREQYCPETGEGWIKIELSCDLAE